MPDPSAPPPDAGNYEPRSYAEPIDSRLPKLDPFWGPQLIVAGAIAVDVLLPNKLTLGPTWLLPGIEGALLVVLVLISPHPRMRHSALRRNIAIGLIGLVSATNIFSLIALAHFLLHGHIRNGRQLVFSGVALWVTNVLLFSLWYWSSTGAVRSSERRGPTGVRTSRFLRPPTPDWVHLAGRRA